jgi:hypothetical protein
MDIDMVASSTGLSASVVDDENPFPCSNRGLMAAPLLHESRNRDPTIQSSLTAASQVAQSLFGINVGPCWGEFFCTHNRIRGHMYAVTHGILFYSNILGFERRLCLQFCDITAVTLYRTTSIQIETTTDLKNDLYVFKSFDNREQVLQLLRGLKGFANKKQSNGNLSSADPMADNGLCDLVAQDQDFGVAPLPSSRMLRSSTSFSFTSTPEVQNRRRAVSDSVLRLIDLTEDRPVHALDDDGFPDSYPGDGGDLRDLWDIAAHEITLLENSGIEASIGIVAPSLN